MTVTPIPYEQGRFFVQSRSRPIEHTVDLVYQDEVNRKPHPMCGCERNFIYDEMCPHILACVEYERLRLNL